MRFLLIFLPLALSISSAPVQAQSPLAQGNELMRQARYTEAEAVFERWLRSDPKNPDAEYHLAMSRALQGRLDEALTGFERVVLIDPARADARFEIAGILLQRGRYRDAFRWAQRGLERAPRDEYGLDLAGTLCFLMDHKLAALGYWNRLDRPHLTEMTISSGRLYRYAVAEEIDLRPGDLLSRREMEKALWRLDRHGSIRQVHLNPVPGPTPDAYGLEVNVDARSGIGSPVEFLVHSLGDVAFRTLDFSYWNLFDKGMSLHVPLRWDPLARNFGFELESPRPLHYPLYLTAGYEWRDESWYLRNERIQDFRLKSHEFHASALFPVRVPVLSTAFNLAYRWRDYSAADSQIQDSPDASFWIGLSPSIRVLNRESPVGWSPRSDLKFDFGWGRYYGTGKRYVSRFSAAWVNGMERTSAGGLYTSIRLGIHAGRLSRDAAAEDHFLLGVGPDADFAMRAHPVFRDGRKGLTPLVSDFVLGNFTFRQDIREWKGLKLGLVAFADTAQVRRPFPGQPDYGTLFDTGIGLDFGLGPLSGKRITISYGRDWKGERNSIYVGANFPY